MKVALLGLALSFLCEADPPAPAPQHVEAAPGQEVLEAIVLGESAGYADAICGGQPGSRRYLEHASCGSETLYGHAWRELVRIVPPDAYPNAPVWRKHRENLARAGDCLDGATPRPPAKRDCILDGVLPDL